MALTLPCYEPKNLENIAKSLASDLRAISPIKAPHRNKQQRMWCVWWLHNNVIQWTPEMVTILLDGVCESTTWHNTMDKLFPNHGIIKNQTHFFRSTMMALLVNAAKKKEAKLPAHFRYPTDIKEEIFGKSQFSACYPKLALQVWTDITEDSRKKYNLESSLFDDLDIKYTSLTAQTNALTRYMLCRGIESFDEMTVESFTDFRVETFIFTPKVELGWKQVCLHLEGKGLLHEGWVAECTAMYTGKKRLAVAANAMNTGDVVTKRSGFFSNVFGEFQSAPQGQQNKALGSIYKQGVALLYNPATNYDVVSFGEFKMARNLQSFAPDLLSVNNDNLWQSSQLSWASKSDIEKNTHKTRINALQYFNAYLYGYLPWFFKKNPQCCFEFPETPSQFIGSVFVKTDPVLDQSYQREAVKQGKEVLYPMSLLSFIEKMVENVRSADKGKNQLRDTCRMLRQYFESTMTKYAGIEGLTLTHNPIPKLNGVGHRRSNKTTKDTFNLGYWVIFRIWLKELTKASLFCSSNAIIEKVPTEVKETLTAERKRISAIKGFEHINKITCSKDFHTYHIPTKIDIGGHELEMGEVRIPEWMTSVTRKLEVGENSARVDISNYQSLLILDVAAYAGQRSSNGANLCADTFDADYIPTEVDDPSTSRVPLRVRTDKVRVEGLDSSIQEDVMILLRYANELLKTFVNKAFAESIYYQGNEQSAKGKFRPLLQGTVNHTGIHPSMAPYVFMFEEWLTKHGIDFDTKMVITPSNLSVEQYNTVKEFKLTDLTKVMLLQYEEWHEPIPFSPMLPKTPLTPHSFRVQLATVINITTGDPDAVSAITGQKKGTVGYYTKATPEDAATLRVIKDKVYKGETVVSAEESVVTEDMLTHLFKELEDNPNQDIPFFAGSEIALQRLKESGGRGLAINYTHICPFDNKCPDEVVAEYGRMNCHDCSAACITSHNAIAIGAAAHKALDEAREYQAMILHSTNRNEQSQLESKSREQIYIASSWITKHSYIRQNPNQFVIAGMDALKQYQYVGDDQISNSLMARLQEVSGTPSLQSQHLRRMSSMIATKLTAKIARNQLPEFSASTQMMLEFDPVKYVVQNLNILAQLKGTDAETLLVETLKQDVDVPLAEELGLD
ncbi:hypothetical protein [Vibrio parahaemolyticus]|uniref:hypothetical protein n=1 Tax=Vibrio parahaemolyticus TaxID=670 RepID=UPI00215C2033|nr:hypothetical protein [Vibrio parahaemolyticus]MCR9805353.1 hypothetical protein [Vibrio parahaemolyticus]